ncbi:MAG TPA: hypothetical protein VIY56_08005, partial [Vicinamibacterales bacterium]
LFERAPIGVLLLGTIGLVLLALEVGIRLGRGRQRRGGGKLEVSGAMVGATMGLLAFMLAFTFNGAATRHDARKALVVEEVNAIETTWLRAGFLPEPHRADSRKHLREYVDVRVKATAGEIALGDALRQSDALQERLWAGAEAVGLQDEESITTGLFVQSLNEVIDLHLERVTVATRNLVPPTIWAALYLLMAIGMFMIGLQIGQGTTRQFGIEVALALSFSLVMFLIIDLDRPQEGLVNVSQQAMVELQAKLHAR